MAFDDSPINRALVEDLATGEFPTQQRNAELIGGIGTAEIAPRDRYRPKLHPQSLQGPLLQRRRSRQPARSRGNGRFAGIELSFDTQISDRLRVGGNFTHIDLDIEDALQPDLRVDGVPENKGLLFATWQPVERLTFTPSIEAADDRWSNVNPPVPDPYIATGDYVLVNFDLAYAFDNGLELAVGARNLRDENYELAWGFPEPGRNVYAKIRVKY